MPPRGKSEQEAAYWRIRRPPDFTYPRKFDSYEDAWAASGRMVLPRELEILAFSANGKILQHAAL